MWLDQRRVTSVFGQWDGMWSLPWSEGTGPGWSDSQPFFSWVTQHMFWARQLRVNAQIQAGHSPSLQLLLIH